MTIGADRGDQRLVASPASNVGFVGALLREPLVVFALVGAGVFLLAAARKAPPAPSVQQPATSSGPIVLTRAERARLIEELARTLERQPTVAELRARIDAYREEEALVREALALGLAEHDPIVRQRLATRLLRTLAEASRPAEPTEAALRERFARLPNEGAERRSGEQLFFARTRPAASADADAARAIAERGAAPTAASDPPPGGRTFFERVESELVAALGAACARSVFTAPIGAWVRCSSSAGEHLIRVQSRTGGTTPRFEDLRPRLREELLAEARANAARVEARALAAKYGWSEQQ